MPKAFRYLSVCIAAAMLAACGTPPSPRSHELDPGPAAQAAKAAVPQAGSMTIAEADKAFAGAGLIPVVRYEPAVVEGAGKVIGSDPAAGTMVAAGSVVMVIVAGTPGRTLDDYVTAHRETFVGIGVDSNGVIIVGVYQKADLSKEMGQLSSLTRGSAFRVQSCPRSWVDLQRVQLELAKRDFAPGADRLSFGMTIDPSACAVRMTADLPDSDVAALTTKYAGALVIQKGAVSRAG